MKVLSPKQKALLASLQAHFEANPSIPAEVYPKEVATAKTLERKGLIALTTTVLLDRTVHEAILTDPNEKVFQGIADLVKALQAATTALETSSNPEELLSHVGNVLDKGRINELRKALRDRALVLFDARNKNG